MTWQSGPPPTALPPTAPPVNHPRADLDLLTPDDICALLKVNRSWLYDTANRARWRPDWASN